MNAANVLPDPGSKALLDFLEGRGGTAERHRAVLMPDLGNFPGIRGATAPRVALSMDGPDSWSVKIEQGRVGFMGATCNSRIYGRPEVLEAIIKGTASGELTTRPIREFIGAQSVAA